MGEKQTEVVKFLNFLSNPNALSSNDLSEIRDWVEKYPYSQSLKFIAVKAAQKDASYSDLLAEAATIAPSRKILYDIIHQSANFFSAVLPFTLEDDFTVEERQIAVSSEENLEDVEDKSKLTFGINLNEIYGSEYKIQKHEQVSLVESIEEKIQGEKITAIADAEQTEKISETEEDSPVESIEEQSPLENFEKETQDDEEVLANADEEPIENVEVEKLDDEILANANQVEEIHNSEVEPEVENIEEETQEEVLANADEEQIENIEKEKLEEVVLASVDEDQVEEIQDAEVEPAVENIEEETQKEEMSVIADEDFKSTENESEIDNIKKETQEEVSAIADEDQVGKIQDTEVEPEVKNIEGKTRKEKVSVIADEGVKETENESEVENIKEETQEEISAIANEDQLEEIPEAVVEHEVENIEVETQEDVSAIANEPIDEAKEIEKEFLIESVKDETEKEGVLAPTGEQIENIEDKIPEDEKQTQKEDPAFQYAPQTDFFALNRKDKLEERQVVEPELKADESVSAYNDERMPYTFLWWLNKTRKEHANTQPYSSFKLDTSRQIKKQETDGLNHQIAENIFHLRGVEELSSSASNYTVPFDFRKKEFQIIEKFIKEEPQIRPPAANKIDSENKAKKSSEDKNQVVSETLAKIYVEQMLYHKALDVYKKLSLKFPEKSTYFASQIKYLELKVN